MPSIATTPGRIRTCDPRFRKPMLYPLSYGGEKFVFASYRGRNTRYKAAASLIPIVHGQATGCIRSVSAGKRFPQRWILGRQSSEKEVSRWRLVPAPPELLPC
jgi:hypothetical protein